MDENLLEQKIEDLIEEKAEKIEQGEQPDSKLGELIEKKVEKKIDEEKETETVPQKTTRRNFMKMLGLGAGGLALSSAASANFFSVNKNVGSTEKTLTDILSNGNSAGSNNLDMASNQIKNVSRMLLDDGGNQVDIFFSEGGTKRVIQRLDPSSGTQGSYFWYFYNNSGNYIDAPLSYDLDTTNLVLQPEGKIDMSSATQMNLPSVTSDPSASAGAMWYRSDLE
jgi:hypothetical protein